MNRNIAISIVIVLAVVIAAVLLYSGRDSSPTPTVTATPLVSASSSMSATPTSSVSPSTSTSASPSSSVSKTPTPSPTKTATPKPSTVTIMYTDEGFSPATVTITKGSTVIWKNNSTKQFWPASGNHPSHLLYPEQTTCFAGVFTNCKIDVGGTYTMKFDLVGTWPYHDHLNSSHYGSIKVTE